MQSHIVIRIVSWHLYRDMYRIMTLLVIHSTTVYGRVRELLDLIYLIKNILICVPKMNGGLTGLKQHEGE